MSNPESSIAQLKQTSSLRQGWVTLALVIITSALFGLIVLPSLHGGKTSPLEGQMAPDFSLEVIAGGDTGNRIKLSALAGKPVVLDFWASWCGPCKQQMPIVDAVARKHAADVTFVGVNTSDSREDAEQYLRSKELAYTMVYDDGSRVGTSYGVRGIPTMVVIGKSGKVSAVRARVVRADELEKLITQSMTQ
jgi:cytochrome c biogenesis protein CcmG/thiol:disulfide interchange protein DsbE